MDAYNPNRESSEHLLDDLDTDLVLIQADQKLRFVDYLIDRGLLFLFWTFIGNHLFSSLFISLHLYMYIRGRWAIYCFSYFFTALTGVIYYTAFEFLSKGKTPGKWVTKTRVVKADGHPMDFKTALRRNLCRAVPFEPFSALSRTPRPWHDQWSKTYVVEEKDSMFPTPKDN